MGRLHVYRCSFTMNVRKIRNAALKRVINYKRCPLTALAEFNQSGSQTCNPTFTTYISIFSARLTVSCSDTWRARSTPGSCALPCLVSPLLITNRVTGPTLRCWRIYLSTVGLLGQTELPEQCLGVGVDPSHLQEHTTSYSHGVTFGSAIFLCCIFLHIFCV